ncbi:hypothetical protein V0288_17405 [Pannus brasiliensis CCIBt3594]|uniref:Uncharacterized protein n=1 Tax=Pannus brasiliensis CCIBt3594 TaxID=1427578 RepID=A0AAW9QYV3_9CHRO
MAKVSGKPLQPNPFLSYRDPKTGLWVVIQGTSLHNCLEISSQEAPHSHTRERVQS